jgi:hypothetical protein
MATEVGEGSASEAMVHKYLESVQAHLESQAGHYRAAGGGLRPGPWSAPGPTVIGYRETPSPSTFTPGITWFTRTP